MTDRPFLAGLVIAFLLLLLVLMYVGWRLRRRRQSGIPHPLAVPDDLGTRLLGVDAFYVATTAADAPLDRIVVGGLGFRSRASVAVFEHGIALGIAGESDAFIPVGDIDRVDRSTATIDRVVERGGLIRVGWRLGGTAVDSYLRVTDPVWQSELIGAIETMRATESTEGSGSHG